VGGGQTGHHHAKPKPHSNFVFNGVYFNTLQYTNYTTLRALITLHYATLHYTNYIALQYATTTTATTTTTTTATYCNNNCNNYNYNYTTSHTTTLH
jgi:hypothetical protein